MYPNVFPQQSVGSSFLKKNKSISFFAALLFLIAFTGTKVSAQTPGFIYQPATNSTGKAVLNPSGSGYTSKTNAGFPAPGSAPNFNDYGSAYSELNMTPIVEVTSEPVGDITTGATGGQTDIVGGSQSVYVLNDGTNLIIRFRIGKNSSASKGYCLLIDNNGKFGPGDPTYTANPASLGFEYSVTLETNFGVVVRNLATNTVVNTYASGTHEQRSVSNSAISSTSNNVFYDFYVPISDIASNPATASLRFAATTVNSGNSDFPSGTPSDINGISDQSYNGNFLAAFTTAVNSFPPTTLSNMTSGFTFAPAVSTAPAIGSAITTSSTTVSGTSTEATGTTITIYRKVGSGSYTSVGTTTVQAGGTWSWTVTGITLAANDLIEAKATASGKSESPESNIITVTSATGTATCNVSVPTGLSGATTSGNNGAITGSWSDGVTTTGTTVTIKVYTIAAGGVPSAAIAAATTTVSFSGTNGTFTTPGFTPTGNFKNSNYLVTATIGSCTSDYSAVIVPSGGTAGIITPNAPTVASPIYVGATGATITNTNTANATLYLYVNGVQSGTPATNIATNGQATINFGSAVSAGDVVTARAIVGTDYLSNASNSVVVITQPVLTASTAPVITGSYVSGTGKTVSGTSVEAAGSSIILYDNGTQVGTATVDNFGNWSVAGLTLAASDLLTAKVTGPGKSISGVSNSVTVGNAASVPTAPAVTSPIFAGATSISGTGGVGTVTVYEDGAVLGTTTGASWTLSGLATTDIYKGGSIYATNTSSSLTSANSSAVTVSGIDHFLIEADGGGNIGTQTAGVAFPIQITAETNPTNGTVFTTYTGTNYVFSNSFVSAGTGPTGSFTAGKLTGWNVTLTTAGTYSVTSTTTDLSVTGTSNTFTINPGPAKLLVIKTQPSTTATNGTYFAQQPAVYIEDQYGNIRTTDNSTQVTVALASGTGTLNGVLTATAVNGVATFSGLSIAGTGNFTLAFSGTSLTGATSNTIAVAAGTPPAPSGLSYTTPNVYTTGTAITPLTPTVTGTVISYSISPTLPTGLSINTVTGVISGTPTVAAAIRNYVVTATNAGGSANSNNISITVNSVGASQLAITTQPSTSAQSGVAFGQPAVVQLEDGSGNAVSQSGVAITASIATGGGTLGGTVTVNTDANGKATFTDLNISGTAGNRTLTFASTGLTSATSNTINITAALAVTISSQTNVIAYGASTGAVTVAGSGGTGPYQYKIGSGSLQTNDTFTNLSAGSYVVTVQDANGVTSTVNVTITQPSAALAVTISSQTNVITYGASTGAVTVAGSGGTGPYQYKIGSGTLQTNDTFTGLAAGPYTVTVQDANGVTSTVNVTITQPSAALAVTISSQTNVIAFGASTGAVTVAGSGGTSPYQYKIGSGSLQTNDTFSSLAAGSYVVTVQDANGVTSTVNVTITQPSAALAVTISSQTNVIAYGASTGAVTVAGSGGTSPYQYKIGSGTLQSGDTFSSLAAGSYVVTVQDANGVTSTVNVTITQPSAALAVTISSQTNVIAYGASTGAVTVAGSGGTSPYQYKIGSGTLQSGDTFTNLSAGSYVVTVQDANGVTSTVNVTITQPSAALAVTISSQTNVIAYGASTGAVTVAGSGGTGPYQYKIGSGTLQTNDTFTGLAAGPYTVTVQDANGVTSTVNVTITQPSAALAVTISSQTNVIAYGASTGAVTVAGSGGTSPYQYKIGSGTLQTNDTFSSLAAGPYTVTVQDANGVTSTVNVTITQPSAALAVTISSQTNVIAYGASTGAVTVAGSGGTGPYQYKIGSGTLQTNDTFTNLIAGSYVVTVQDANGITSTVNVTITQPSAALAVTISSQTNVIAYGGSTGAVTVAGSGGTGPYQYKIGSGTLQTNDTFTGLAAGTYTVTVQDANGVTSTVNVTITQPSAALAVTISSQTNVIAYGGSTGTVTVAGSGGTAPYQYKIGSGSLQTNDTFTNLIAGTYTVTVQDANGVTSTVNVTITQPSAALAVTISSQTNVIAYGASTGAVTVAGSGGTGPYQYKIGSGSLQTNDTFTGLIAGSYTVTVQDVNGVTSTVNVTITQPSAALAVTISSQTNVIAFGASTGAVTVAGSGGTGPYQYKIGSGSLQTNDTFTGLAAGPYTVTVQDANGVTSTVNVTITQPSAALAVTISSQTNVIAYGASTGAVTVAGSGGTGPYQYKIGSGSLQTNDTFTGLAAGPYTVTVQDANGVTSTVNVTITQPSAALAVTISSQTNVIAYGASTGAVTVAGSGGTGPYQYKIGSGSLQTNDTFTGLAAGPYTVTVQDANGVTSTVNVTITQPSAALAVTISSQTNVIAFGASTGAVTVAGSGGTSPYQYKIGSGSLQTNDTFSSLAAGSYVVTVQDANGVTSTVNVTITQPSAALAVTISSQTNVIAYGASTGAVTVAGSGGTSPYQYKIGSGTLQSGDTFSSLAAGSYVVTVQDANGVTSTVNVTITQPSAALAVTISSQTNVIAYGASTGAVTVAGSGGTSPYQYKIGSGTLQSGDTFTNLSAGSYVVTVQDANGVTSTVNVTITQPSAALAVTISSQTNVIAYGASTGAVTVAGSGGTGPYQYKIGSGTLQTNDTFTGLAAGPYTVTVQDANGVTSTVNVTITQPSAALAVTISSQTNVIAYGASTGAVTVAGSGGTSPYQYKIGSGTLQTNDTFSSLAAGPYTVTVQDANGVTSTVNVTITQPSAALAVTISSQTNVIAYGASTGAVTVAGSGGTGPYQYKIGSGTLQTNDTFTNLIAGSYVVTVQDANGITSTVNVTITQPSAALAVTISSQTNVIAYGGSTGAVTVAGSGGTGPYQYKIGSGTLQTNDTFTGLAAGTYTVTVQDANGVTSTVNVTITQPSAALAVTISSQTNVIAYGGSTGTVTVAGSGGTAPYQYKIGSGSLQTNDTFTNLIAGTYTVTVQDANGVTSTVNVTITQPSAALAVTISSQTNVIAYGASTGAVTVAGSGGTGPYQYKIGSGSLQTNDTFSSLAAGSYVVTVQDANGVTSTVNVTITQPSAALAVTISSQTNVIAYGASTGAVTVAGSGGTSPYQYKIGSGTLQSGDTFSSLAAGPYTVTVQDANGVTSTVNVTITQPSAALAVTISSQTNVIAYGGSTGTVTVAGSGGTAPYQYKIGSGSLQTNDTFTNLIAGTYTVTVQDANGVTSTVNVTITQPSAALAVTISSQTNVIAYGASTGAVTVAGSGGTGPYQYKIGSGSLQTNDTFTGLTAGPYVVTVQDANGVTSTVNVTITQPSSALAVTISSQTNVIAYGGSTGTVTVAGSGGTAPYQYKIGSGSLQTNDTFTNLIAGTYTVTVQDANGVTSTVNVTITQPSAALAVTISSQTNVIAYGASTGAVTVAGSGGTGPYQYKIGSGSLQTNDTFTGLIAGSYTVTVQDANGVTSTVNVTITQPSAALAVTISSQTNVIAYGASTGAVTVAGSGGTAPYQYKIGSGTLQTNDTFTGLAAGSYVVTVQDANGVTSTVNVTITQPSAALAVTISSQTNVIAYGASTGAVTVAGSGGTGPYQYKIGNGSLQSSGSFSGLSAGIYVVTVSDANGVTSTVNVTIGQPSAALAVNISSQTNVIAYGASTGAVTVVGTGGTGPYQYKIGNGSLQSSGSFSGLSAGIYVVTVSDANGVTSTVNVTIGQPLAALAVNISSQTNVIAYGASTGAVTVTGSGGTGPYQYKIGNGSLQSSGSFSGLAAGTYVVTVRDANGVTSTVNVTIGQPSAALAVNISSQTNVNPGGALGAVTVTGTGGTGPYQYKIGSGNLQNSGTFSGLAAGTYVVTIKDANGVTSTVTITISQLTQVITFAALPIETYGNADFAPGATSNNNTNAIVYTSSNTAVATIVNGNIHIVGAGAANITASQAGDANNTAAANVTQPLTVAKANLTVTAVDKARLYAAASPAFTVTYAGFVNGDDASKLSTAAVASTTADALSAPGTYPIIAGGASSANYSFNYVNGALTVIALSDVTLSSLVPSVGTLSPSFNTGTLNYNISVGYDVSSIYFTPTFAGTGSATINGTPVPNGSASYNIMLNTGNNIISIVITAQDGVTKKTYLVTVYKALKPADIIPTNVLTPNGDGKNDAWVVKDIELYPDNKVSIFDRAGRPIYMKKGYTNDWDGTLNGTTLTQGTYYYMIELAPGMKPIKGFITILKSK